MSSKPNWLMSTSGVIVCATVLTLIVLAESMFPPWRPYFLIYAVLAIWIPLQLGAYTFGSFRESFRGKWGLILGILAISLIWDLGVSSWCYEHLVAKMGHPEFSLNQAVIDLFKKAAAQFHISMDSAMGIYAVYIVLWAPIGEELFYRGYLFGALRAKCGDSGAAWISALFFGVRHATHLFYLWPAVPLVAAASWVVSAIVFGLLMSELYRRTNSLYPPMIVHLIVNLGELAMG